MGKSKIKNQNFNNFSFYTLNFSFQNGVSLIELLIVMGIIATISFVATINILDERSSQELESAIKSIAATLRSSQEKSMTQAEGSGWGVRFLNDTEDSYQLLKDSSPTGAKYTLKSSLEFDSAVPSSQDLVFIKLSGKPNTAASIIVKTKGATCPDAENCKTININTNGTITY